MRKILLELQIDLTGTAAESYSDQDVVKDYLGKNLSEFEWKVLPKFAGIKSVCDCMQNLYKDGIFIKCKKCNRTVNIQEQTVL